MNNTLEEIHSRIIDAEAWINDLEDRIVEITATEQSIGKRMKRTDDTLRDLWDIKCVNIHIIGVPEGEQREGPEKIFEEIIAENFPERRRENSQPNSGSTENPRKEKPKEEHTKTYSNQTDKN